MSEASCLCCGHVGTPKVSLIDRPEVYVCERCHRRSTLPMPEQGFSTEEEGDAYTHGWFDCNEAHRPSGVTVTNAWKAEQPITNAPRSISEPTAGVALPAAPTYSPVKREHRSPAGPNSVCLVPGDYERRIKELEPSLGKMRAMARADMELDEARTAGVNAVAAPLVDWPAIHRGFASAAPAVEAAATRINEAAEALMANHFGGLGLRGPNVNDPPTYQRPPAPPQPPGVPASDSKTQAPKGPDHG